MKKTVLILMFFLLYAGVHSQTLSPRLIASAGGSSSVAGGTVSWSIGETNIATLTSGTTVLSQGIQQPEVDILTGSITGTAFCAGVAVSVPFTASGYYGSGNVFTAQLSNSTGSFASPIDIGTFTATGSGNITVTIPTATLQGTSYRIRVIANLPGFMGLDNGANFTVNPSPIPIITGSPDNFYDVPKLATYQYSTPANAGDLYSWSAPGLKGYCSANAKNCVNILFEDPCGSYGQWTINVIETNPSTGCSATATKLIYITP